MNKIQDDCSASVPKVVHVIPRDGIGGVEVAVRSMVMRDIENFDFRLVLVAGRAVTSSPRVVESPTDRLYHPIAHFRALRAILRLKPDVLICSLWWSVTACVLAKLARPRTRLVMFLHTERSVHILERMLNRLGMTVADEVWSDSDETLAARKPPVATPKRVVSFVTERLEPARPAGAAGPRFVCWARIAPEKGFDRAITLIRLLVDRAIDARFDIYGPDGGEQPALERLAAKLGLEANVSFPGPIDRRELARIAAENSFFLQLSRFEGMALGAVEAMQLGLVPIVTPVGQMKAYIGADNGIHVDPHNLPATADRIAALLADEAAYNRLRERAIAHWRQSPLYGDQVVSCARALSSHLRRLPGQ